MFAGEWFEFVSVPSFAEVLTVENGADIDKGLGKYYSLGASLIKSWSVIGADNQPAPITFENVRRLPAGMLEVVFEYLTTVETSFLELKFLQSNPDASQPS